MARKNHPHSTDDQTVCLMLEILEHIMKSVNTLLVIILSMIVGCRGDSKQSTDELLIVDVTASYPQKELILQDFMTVEYVPLETSDDFVNQGFVLAIGKEVMLVKNRVNDGDIFIYDINGKALRKINRKGQGAEEYLFIHEITLDEDNNEMFVNDLLRKKILVYDLYGKFKRSFDHPNSATYANIHLYDKDNLICYDCSVNDNEGEDRGSQSFHFVISKQDGRINREIFIPFKITNSHKIFHEEYVFTFLSDDYSIIPFLGNWMLVDLSTDTIYHYSPDGRLSPFIVRTPSIRSMTPDKILLLKNITERYYFMETYRKELDVKTMNVLARPEYLVYDRQEKAIFNYKVYNNEYLEKRQIDMGNLITSDDIAFWRIMEAHRLVEYYKKGDFRDGKLKDIASRLDEEDNPVIMLIKHKK